MVEPLDVNHHPAVGLPKSLHLPDEGPVLFADGDEVRAISHVQPLGTSLDGFVVKLARALAFGAGLPVALVSVAPSPDRPAVHAVHVDTATGPNRRLERKDIKMRDIR